MKGIVFPSNKKKLLNTEPEILHGQKYFLGGGSLYDFIFDQPLKLWPMGKKREKDKEKQKFEYFKKETNF